jgi:periplasmic protein TonB
MTAANPAQRTPTGLPPYFRRYELPWSPAEEMERRFRVILRNLGVAFAIVAVIMPFLPRHPHVVNTDSLPERVVQLVMEPPPPPPPPPPPKPEKPPEKAPVSAKPTPAVPVDPRVKASKSGLLASLDDLAALRDQVDLDKFAKNQAKTMDPGDVSAVQRSLITSKAGGTSGGISAPTSNGLAAGSGSLNGIRTAQIKDPTLASGGPATRAGGSGKASRGSEEIALVFTKNKGAIDAMYARALRDSPALQGKVVIEMTIAPSGEITAARIVSSELNDPEFEAKLLARIRLFKFDAKDVASLTATKPIDFFPAG